MTTDERQPWEGWALIELMGHRKRAGYVTQEEVAGHAMLRVDIPGADGQAVTQYYNAASLYAMTPVSEEIARGFAAKNTAAPVNRYELALPKPIEATHVIPTDNANQDFDPYEGIDDDPDDDKEPY